MRRLTVFIWSFLCFTVLPLAVTSQEGFIPSPEFIRSRIRNAYSTIQDLQCYVRIIKVRNGNKRKSNAKLYFKPPGKILLKFTRPRRQVICSNGKTLWIYVPKLNVVFSHTFSSDEKKRALNAVGFFRAKNEAVSGLPDVVCEGKNSQAARVE